MTPTRTIHFSKNMTLIKNGATAALGVTVADPRLLDQPFDHQQIDLAKISISAQGGQDLTFLNGQSEIKFRASAAANAGAGVFLDGNAIATELALDSNIVLDMPADPVKHFTLLRCGFDVNASLNGSVALGAGGSVSLGLDAAAEANYAVIGRFTDKAQSGFDELTAVANRWKLPAHIKTDADLEQGTWIAADVGGSINVKIGAQYGFDYNWVRKLNLGGLAGDVGLRVHLGVNAALGLSASGTYMVVVSRDSLTPGDRVVRVRLFRRSQRGRSIALNAGAEFDPSTPILPSNVDDFIKAIFGVHGAQVISDLNIVKQWTGDQSTLGGLLAAAGIDRSRQLLKDLTGIDPETAFNTAKAKLTGFLDKWNNLPHSVSTLVLKFFGDHVDLAPVKQVADLIANGTQDQFSALLADKLKDVAFFQTPVGQYLESLTSKGLVSLLDSSEFANVKDIAAKTLAVLDGSEVENILKALQNEIVTALNLQPLADLVTQVDQTTFDSLDKLLKAKLAAFLDKAITELGLQDVEKIRIAIGKLLSRRQELYQKAKDALNHQYKFNFAATYQSQTTRGALADLAFDFARGDNATLSNALQDAINGKLDQILITPVIGLSINKAQLTHELKRQGHAEFNMPYFSTSSDELLTSDASVMPVEEQGGKLLAYDLRAQDRVTARIGAKIHRSSTLAVSAHLGVAAGGDFRIHSGSSLTYAYDFRQSVTGMKVPDFEDQTTRYIKAYFGSLFLNGDGTPANWTSLIERKAGANGTLGNTILTLDLSVPSTVAAAWLIQADANENLRRLRMKRALHAALQNLIAFYFFGDLTQFNNVGFGVDALLVYQGPDLDLNVLNDLANDSSIRGFVNGAANGDGQSALGRVLDFWSARLQAVNHPNRNFFVNNGINRNRIVQDASFGAGLGNVRSLLITEAQVLDSAEKARQDILTFLSSGSLKPSDSIAVLAQFGADLVSTFNKNIDSLYGGDALRPLGTLAFLEAARALSGVVSQANAMLDVTVVKPSIDPHTFVDAETEPTPDQIVAESRLVAAAVAPALPLAAG